MSLLSKMVTALKGGFNEAGEAFVHHQALRILDQEMRDADAELRQNRALLLEQMAQHKVALGRLEALSQEIETHEGYALKALEQGEQPLAHEVAKKIAELESRHKEQSSTCHRMAFDVDKMQQVVHKAELQLQRLKQQVDTVKANHSVLRAQKSVAERSSGTDSRLRTALNTLERVRDQQTLEAQRIEAEKSLNVNTQQDPLQEKLRKAGIINSDPDANAILDRLKQKTSEGS